MAVTEPCSEVEDKAITKPSRDQVVREPESRMEPEAGKLVNSLVTRSTHVSVCTFSPSSKHHVDPPALQ